MKDQSPGTLPSAIAGSPVNLKRQGEWAEVCFLEKVIGLGLVVSKPYGESAPYDFVVDAGGRLWRVQVKSVTACQGTAYQITCGIGTCKRAYSNGEIDLLAAYVIPADAWYLIPLSAFAPAKRLWLAPHRPSKRRYEAFREAWWQLTLPPKSPRRESALELGPDEAMSLKA